jgi:hypothetical protein
MSTQLTLRQLNRTTLLRQSLLERAAEDPVTAIHRLGGLQAQYANSPYIALWSRLRNFRIEALESALNNRSVVKASAIRNTLHLVSADDYPFFNEARSVARTANWAASARRAGVDPGQLHRRLLSFAREPRTVAEMEGDLEELASDASLAGSVPSGVRHVAFQIASVHGWLVHVPPSGHWNEFGTARYIDAGVWLRAAKRPDFDDALRALVERYLGAYGPASVADIAKWAGQPRLPKVKEAIAALGDKILRFRGPDDRQLVDLVHAPVATGDEIAPARFLARWDNVLIGYDFRDRILPPDVVPMVVKRNGDFLPSFLVDGFVAGTWATGSENGKLVIQLVPSGKVAAAARAELEAEAGELARFIARDDRPTDVRWAKA